MTDTIIDTIISILLLPLQAVMYPIDLLLQQIPNIEVVPATINSVIAYIAGIPSTIVAMTGVSPILWNIYISIFLLWVVSAPTANIIKKVWAFVRP